MNLSILDQQIGLAKQESMAMIPRIFRVNLESMVMNPGGKIGLISLAFSMVNLESMVMNLSILDPEILDREIGLAKQESMAMIPRIFRVNLESMAMNPGIFSMVNLESMVMNLSILDREILDREIGRAKQESMAMIPRIFRVNLESM